MQQTTGSVCRGSCRSLERTASLHTASYRVAVWCVAWDGRIGLLVNSIQPCFLLHPGVVCRSAAAERLPRLRHVSDARACDDGFPLYLPLWKMRRVRGEGHAFKTTNTGRKHRIPGSVAKVSTSGVWVVCLLGKGPRAKINENLAQRYCTAVASKMLEYEQEYKHTELCRSPSRSPPPRVFTSVEAQRVDGLSSPRVSEAPYALEGGQVAGERSGSTGRFRGRFGLCLRAAGHVHVVSQRHLLTPKKHGRKIQYGYHSASVSKKQEEGLSREMVKTLCARPKHVLK